MPHLEYFAASLKKHDTREGFLYSYSINTLVTGAVIKNLLRCECLEHRDGIKQTPKANIVQNTKKLQCFQGVLISDTMCKEPLWVREGVSLHHSDHAHELFPFAERDQSVFLSLKEEFKAQLGATGITCCTGFRQNLTL